MNPVIETEGLYLDRAEADATCNRLNTDLTKHGYRTVTLTHKHSVVGYLVVHRDVWQGLIPGAKVLEPQQVEHLVEEARGVEISDRHWTQVDAGDRAEFGTHLAETLLNALAETTPECPADCSDCVEHRACIGED